MHAKYMTVDNYTVSISSVNWSKTSYTANREAGIVFSGESEAIGQFTQAVFEKDWALGVPLEVTQVYSAEDMAIITNTSTINVVQPPPFSKPSAYITPEPQPLPFASNSQITVMTSPDFARAQVLDSLASVTSTFQLMIY